MELGGSQAIPAAIYPIDAVLIYSSIKVFIDSGHKQAIEPKAR